MEHRTRQNPASNKLAYGLGWFSIILGAAEIAAPRAVARLIGVKASPALFRLFGLRELISGIGILSQSRKAPWLKARVAGDAMDLAALGTAFATPGSLKTNLASATAAVAGVTALDVICARKLSHSDSDGKELSVRKSLIISRPPEELYRFWHEFEQLPRFMNHLESVKQIDSRRSHWVAKGPAGMRVEWDAEITADKPNELIAWRSLEGSDVDSSGEVRFEPATGGRGTVLRVQLEYHPPGGRPGALIAKLFGEAPEKQIAVDLLRFKQLVEAGEVARTEGQSAGRARSTSKKYDEFVRT